MPNYRRLHVPGKTYFFTVVQQSCETLRIAINKVRQTYPFSIDAIVLLPNHLHCLWTLPPGDSNYAERLRLIKTYVTKHCASELAVDAEITRSRQKRQEGNLWQRRFWEHLIRDEEDFARHCDYIHYNPVKHGLCRKPKQWQYSSIHRFVAQGFYPEDWGE